MNDYRAIAIKIPDEVRSQRLMVKSDPIDRAVAASGNTEMQLLFAIWFEFIQPRKDEDMSCPKCLHRLLANFKEMKPELIALEKEYKLLNSIA